MKLSPQDHTPRQGKVLDGKLGAHTLELRSSVWAAELRNPDFWEVVSTQIVIKPRLTIVNVY
jgi:hypothetical protein